MKSEFELFKVKGYIAIARNMDGYILYERGDKTHITKNISHAWLHKEYKTVNKLVNKYNKEHVNKIDFDIKFVKLVHSNSYEIKESR